MRLEVNWEQLDMKYDVYSLGQLVNIKYGKNQKKVQSNTGTIPIYGNGGFMGYATEALYNKPPVLIGRKGTINKVRYVDHPFWTVDTLFYTEVNDNLVIPKYLYYLMSLIDLESYNEGTTIPSLRTETLKRLEFNIPDLESQKRVLSVLEPIDQKINMNDKINENLEQQAQALFKSWFLDYDPWNGCIPDSWIKGKLGDFTDIKRGGSPRPIQQYLSDTGLRWLKISDVTSLHTPFVIDIKEHIIKEGLKKTVLLKKGALVLSNSATPGIPKILDVDSCIHDGWLYFPESKFSKEYLYLYFKYIRQQLVNLSNGSVFNNLKIDILKGYPTILPDEDILKYFDGIVKPIFLQIQNLTRESYRLADIRDTILPQLMTGRIDVSDIIL